MWRSCRDGPCPEEDVNAPRLVRQGFAEPGADAFGRRFAWLTPIRRDVGVEMWTQPV